MNKKDRIEKKRMQRKNRELVKKYPWLVPRRWDGKIPDDYDYTYITWGWTKGWDAAFGDMYLEELGDAVKHSGFENEFAVLEQKEKYGMARNYVSPVNDEINIIIDKYEVLSQNICISCGKPDVHMINDGWISPWCPECYIKNWRQREKRASKYREIEPDPESKIMQTYEKCICDDKADMQETIKWRDKEIDISETASAIRERWEKRKKHYEAAKRRRKER